MEVEVLASVLFAEFVQRFQKLKPNGFFPRLKRNEKLQPKVVAQAVIFSAKQLLDAQVGEGYLSDQVHERQNSGSRRKGDVLSVRKYIQRLTHGPLDFELSV